MTPCSPAAYWGLASAFFASLCLVLFVYLYVTAEAKKQPPSRGVLLLVGALSAVGVAAGVGAFSTYLGLGIINTLHGDGESAAEPVPRPELAAPSSLLPPADRPLFQTEYIVCVWAFMTGKWGVTGYYYSVRSRNTRHTSGYYTAL